MKTDHRYRNVDIEVCLNFPTVEDIVVKWLGKIIMNHDGISKNRNNWLVTIGQLVLVWSVLMMCSATIIVSRLTADAKQDLACDREQQPAGARPARRRVATVVLRNCELARCWMCSVSRSRHRLESWHQSRHRSPSRYCTTTEQSMILKLGIRPADQHCFAWLGAAGIKTET